MGRVVENPGQRVLEDRDRLDESPSGVTSKPTIEGHFKTDQWNTTLDELVLPYRLARWQVRFEYQHSILQDLIPVFSFLDRELGFDN